MLSTLPHANLSWGKRDAHVNLVQPSNEIVLGWQFQDGQLQSYHYVHGNNSYVNLEPLQSHDLLLNRRSLCVETEAQTKSTLNIDSRHPDVYHAAKEAWQEPRLLFVVEDDTCHEDGGLRSVYRAEDIKFDDDALAVQVVGEHLNFGPYGAEATHNVTIHTGSFRQLKKRSKSQFYLTSRLERGITGHLQKRCMQGEDNSCRQIEDLGSLNKHADMIPSLPIIDDLPGATKLTDVVSLPTEIAKKPIETVEDYFGGDSNDLLENIKKFGLDKMHDLFEEIEEATSFRFNKTMNIEFEGNFDGSHSSKERMQIGEDLAKYISLPNITLINTYAKANLDIGVGVTFNIVGAADKIFGGDVSEGLKGAFEDSIEDLYVQAEAVEDLHIRLQAEIQGSAGAYVVCLVWFYPDPGAYSCTVSPVIQNNVYAYDVLENQEDEGDKNNPQNPEDDKKKKGKHLGDWPGKLRSLGNLKENVAGVGGFSVELTAGLACWVGFTASLGQWELGIKDGLNEHRNNLNAAYYNHTGDKTLNGTYNPYIFNSTAGHYNGTSHRPANSTKIPPPHNNTSAHNTTGGYRICTWWKVFGSNKPPWLTC